MKRVVPFFFAIFPTLIAAQGIQVLVNQRPVAFRDMVPIESRGKVLVPLRGVFEQLGASVDYDAASQTVMVNKGETLIKVTIGNDYAYLDEATVLMKAKAILRNGRVLVPLRFFAETLDAQVHWDGGTRSVQITTQATIPPK